MTKCYDVVIVGAGPGGLTAAKFAGENGLNVAILERKTHIVDINRACTMMVLVLNEYIFGERPTLNERNKRLCFPVNGFSLRYEGPTKNLYAWHFYSPGGQCISFGDHDKAERLGDEGRISVVHSKAALLQDLLEDTQRAGVEVFTDSNAVDIEKTGDRVSVKTADGRTFTGTFVIAADGTTWPEGSASTTREHSTRLWWVTGGKCGGWKWKALCRSRLGWQRTVDLSIFSPSPGPTAMNSYYLPVASILIWIGIPSWIILSNEAYSPNGFAMLSS
jgi:hypothetical protein